MSTHDQTLIRLNCGSDLEIAQTLKMLLENTHTTVVFAEDEFWCYQAPAWRALDVREIHELVYQFDGQNPGWAGPSYLIRISRSRVKSVTALLADMLAKPGFFSQAEIGINCLSGFIVFDASGRPEQKPHSPDQRQRFVVQARWGAGNQDSRNPDSLVETLIHGAFAGDEDATQKCSLIEELLGCVALGYGTRLREPKAVILYGERAANGKSAVLDLIRGIVPADAVASMPLDALNEPAFAVRLRGKRLNASDELSGRAVRSSVFKSVVTGEPIAARALYRNPEEFRPIAQHVYATNELPSFQSGMDRGTRRRLLVLTFNNVISPNDRIEHLGRLIHEREAAIVLDLAVSGASRLIRNGKFTEPKSSMIALRDWVFGDDPVLAWVELCCGYSDAAEPVRTRDAYTNFCDWAARERFDKGRLPSINSFVTRVKAVLPEFDPRGKAGAHYHRDKFGGHFRGLLVKL